MRPRHEISVPPGRDANSCIRQRNAKTAVKYKQWVIGKVHHMADIGIAVIGSFCATLPNARVCAGFAGDYSWSGSIFGGALHLTFLQRSDFLCSLTQAFAHFQCHVANQFDRYPGVFRLQNLKFSRRQHEGFGVLVRPHISRARASV